MDRLDIPADLVQSVVTRGVVCAGASGAIFDLPATRECWKPGAGDRLPAGISGSSPAALGGASISVPIPRSCRQIALATRSAGCAAVLLVPPLKWYRRPPMKSKMHQAALVKWKRQELRCGVRPSYSAPAN